MSLLHLLLKSDIVIKAVLGFLLVLSVLTCAVLLQKLRDFRYSKLRIKVFEKRFWSGVTLEEFYEVNQNRLNSPVGIVFEAAMEEWNSSGVAKNWDLVSQIKGSIYERLENATEGALIEVESSMSRYDGFISVVVSIAPFVGLFGTVWGVINCFSALSLTSSASLSTLAPGIGEALITTAAGIFVSILGVITGVVNHSTSKSIISETERFRFDLLSVLSRELDSFTGSVAKKSSSGLGKK